MLKHTITLVAVTGLVFVLASATQAGLVGQLGVLDEAWFNTNPTNPGTGEAWQSGDTYHLAFVTSTTRDATSSDIGVYNDFVQGVADAAGLGSSEGVTWNVMASTSTVNARDNALVSAPVYNMNAEPELFATGYEDIWDSDQPAGILIYNETGGAVVDEGWHRTGSNGDGTAHQPLGTDNPTMGNPGKTGGQWMRDGWPDYPAAGTPYHFYALSETLEVEQVVIPEPSSLALVALSLAGLCFRRRRN